MKQSFLLVDERISDKCLYTLSSLGFSPIRLSKMPTLPAPIASHTDILSFKIYDKIFFSRKYFKDFGNILPSDLSDKILLTSEAQGDSYPYDAIFNGLIMGDTLFCKSDTFSKEISEYAIASGVKIVPVKQGYPACATLKISENAAITADKGMEKALSAEGISVLLIENGGVSLPPYQYGFIGGAGALHGDTVYFIGDISSHPEANRILKFIEENGKHAVSLSDEPLSDLGGILFV